MSSEAKHTPTPWFIGRSHRGDQELLWIDSVEAPACGIADLYHRIDAGPEGFYAKPEAEANAALIVKAVNAHEHLIAALRKLQFWNEGIQAGRGNHYPHDHLAVIKAALAKAAEKPEVLPPRVEAP